jgi:hypothetical protein
MWACKIANRSLGFINIKWDDFSFMKIGVYKYSVIPDYQHKLSQTLILALRVADIYHWRWLRPPQASPVKSQS